MNNDELNKSRNELAETIEKIDVEKIANVVLKKMLEIYIHNNKPILGGRGGLTEGEGEIAWGQSYVKSNSHNQTHDNNTPGPHSKSWSEALA